MKVRHIGARVTNGHSLSHKVRGRARHPAKIPRNRHVALCGQMGIEPNEIAKQILARTPVTEAM